MSVHDEDYFINAQLDIYVLNCNTVSYHRHLVSVKKNVYQVLNFHFCKMSPGRELPPIFEIHGRLGK